MAQDLKKILEHASPDVLELNQQLVVGRITELGGDPEAFMDMAKRNKFGAIKTTVDGIIFDSKKEAKRYEKLKAMKDRGEIRKLILQPKFLLQEAFVTPDGEKIRPITYTPDFQRLCAN